MINIIDFDHGCGGLTAGMERYGEFLTIDNIYLNEYNEHCYNEVHINPFWTEAHVSEEDYDDLNIQVACFSPDVGGSLARRGHKNFKLNEIRKEMRWIKIFQPPLVIFSLQPDVLSHLHKKPSQISTEVCKTADGWPFFDKLLSFLHVNGYSKVILVTINYLDYNIPQDKKRSFYIAWDNDKDFELHMPQISRRYKVIDVLKKVPVMDVWHQPNNTYYSNCSKVKQGFGASNTPSINPNTGYVRLFADKIAPHLTSSFYKVSSRSPSIHPIEHRPLTIREGALLNGLDNTFSWDSSIPNKKVAEMIADSVSPVIGYYLAHSIFDILS